MDETLISILVGTSGLGVAAVIALHLTFTRCPSGPGIHLIPIGALAIAFQGLHFAEELATGFHVRFPEMLGLAPWPLSFFVTFNLVWIVVWGLSLLGLSGHVRAAYFPLWFLGIGSAVNGVAHPILFMVESGYFPGLLTSPIVGLLGVLLFRELFLQTRVERAAGE